MKLRYLTQYLKALFKPRSIQEIFDVVIKEDLYSSTASSRQSGYMCLALLEAKWSLLITPKEAKQAKKEIDLYLEEKDTLVGYLITKKLPHQFKDTLAIYKDWKNRPIVVVNNIKL